MFYYAIESRRFALADVMVSVWVSSYRSYFACGVKVTKAPFKGNIPLKSPWDRFVRLFFWSGIHAPILTGARRSGMEESRLFYRRKVEGITFMWLAPFYYAIESRRFALADSIVSA